MKYVAYTHIYNTPFDAPDVVGRLDVLQQYRKTLPKCAQQQNKNVAFWLQLGPKIMHLVWCKSWRKFKFEFLWSHVKEGLPQNRRIRHRSHLYNDAPMLHGCICVFILNGGCRWSSSINEECFVVSLCFVIYNCVCHTTILHAEWNTHQSHHRWYCNTWAYWRRVRYIGEE